VPGAEVSQLSDALRIASKPSDDVVAPSFVCFEAERKELIRYPETYGVYREAKAEFDRDGFSAARRKLGKVDFYQLIMETKAGRSGFVNKSYSLTRKMLLRVIKQLARTVGQPQRFSHYSMIPKSDCHTLFVDVQTAEDVIVTSNEGCVLKLSCHRRFSSNKLLSFCLF